jgi:uncharacterized protein
VTGSAPELRIGVSELRRRPGNRRRIEREVPLDGTAISTASVPDGAPAHVDVVLESLTDGVTVAGSVQVAWVGPCRRCLEDTDGTVVAEIHEVFTYNPIGGETLALDGDTLDLGPVVRDAVVLNLPLAPLCREDCPGPAPELFPVVTATDAPPPVDPRWSALAELHLEGDEDDPFDPEGPDPVE